MRIGGITMEKQQQTMSRKKKEIEKLDGRQLLVDFTTEMDRLYDWFIEARERYENSLFDLPEFAGYNQEYAEKFIKTYDIIQSRLTVSQRNLLYIFTATGQSYKQTIEILHGEVKNIATLRVMIHKIRKIIKEAMV